MKHSILMLSYNEDLDGLFSAELIKYIYDDDVDVIYTSYKDAYDSIRIVEGKADQYKKVIIADLNFGDRVNKEANAVFIKLLTLHTNISVEIIDHHTDTVSTVSSLDYLGHIINHSANLIDGRKTSTAELIYNAYNDFFKKEHEKGSIANLEVFGYMITMIQEWDSWNWKANNSEDARLLELQRCEYPHTSMNLVRPFEKHLLLCAKSWETYDDFKEFISKETPNFEKELGIIRKHVLSNSIYIEKANDQDTRIRIFDLPKNFDLKYRALCMDALLSEGLAKYLGVGHLVTLKFYSNSKCNTDLQEAIKMPFANPNTNYVVYPRDFLISELKLDKNVFNKPNAWDIVFNRIVERL